MINSALAGAVSQSAGATAAGITATKTKKLLHVYPNHGCPDWLISANGQLLGIIADKETAVFAARKLRDQYPDEYELCLCDGLTQGEAQEPEQEITPVCNDNLEDTEETAAEHYKLSRKENWEVWGAFILAFLLLVFGIMWMAGMK